MATKRLAQLFIKFTLLSKQVGTDINANKDDTRVLLYEEYDEIIGRLQSKRNKHVNLNPYRNEGFDHKSDTSLIHDSTSSYFSDTRHSSVSIYTISTDAPSVISGTDVDGNYQHPYRKNDRNFLPNPTNRPHVQNMNGNFHHIKGKRIRGCEYVNQDGYLYNSHTEIPLVGSDGRLQNYSNYVKSNSDNGDIEKQTYRANIYDTDSPPEILVTPL